MAATILLVDSGNHTHPDFLTLKIPNFSKTLITFATNRMLFVYSWLELVVKIMILEGIVMH